VVVNEDIEFEMSLASTTNTFVRTADLVTPDAFVASNA
jgi:hypothetical protein